MYQFEDPVGVPGLHEDISGGVIQPKHILTMIKQGISNADAGETTYEKVYRTFSRYLRDFIKSGTLVEECQGLLKKLLLNVTVPWNELDTPDYKDSYTGEPVAEDDWGLDEGEQNRINLSKTNASITDWNHYIALRKPYQDEDDNKRFVSSNAEYVGQEEEELLPEDNRERIPEYFNHEGVPDEDYPEDAQAASKVLDHLISVRRERGFPWQWLTDKLITYLQDRIDAGANYNNISRIFLDFEMYGFVKAQDAGRIFLEDHEENNLRSWINLFYEELCEHMDACGPAEDWFELTDQEIAEIGEHMLDEYLASIPTEGDHSPFNINRDPRTRSRYFVQGYIQGVIDGLPSKGDYTVLDMAWDTWRSSICPEGQQEFLRLRQQGASRLQAMRGFYKVTEQKGIILPVKPKKIKAIRSTGLVLTNGKFVNWRIASKIAHEEGFSLSNEDKKRLLTILNEKGWGQGFASIV